MKLPFEFEVQAVAEISLDQSGVWFGPRVCVEIEALMVLARLKHIDPEIFDSIMDMAEVMAAKLEMSPGSLLA